MLPSNLLPSYQEFERQIKEWCEEAGEDVTYEFAQVGARTLLKVLFVPVEHDTKLPAIHCRNI